MRRAEMGTGIVKNLGTQQGTSAIGNGNDKAREEDVLNHRIESGFAPASG